MIDKTEVDKNWLKWLEYFHAYADFGPADDDVRHMLYDDFKEVTGITIEEMEEE